MWQEILTSVLTSSVITGIFVAILNKAIENKFDMKLEAYKDKLKFESDKEIMQLTKDLELKASERSIKLTRIFEKQAEAIIELYKQLIVLKRDINEVSETLASNPDWQSKIARAMLTFDGFNRLCEDNRILLPFKSLESIEGVRKLLGTQLGANLGRSMFKADAESEAPAFTVEDRLANTKIRHEAEKSIPDALNVLESDFKKVLGVSMDEVLGQEKTP